MHLSSRFITLHRWILATAFIATIAVYWPGLQGGFVFDDYPNIVDNHAVQPHDASFSSLVNAALSSPASEFKRPLASLSFAANYLVSGIDPYWMKLTNLVIHLLNGLLIFLLARAMLLQTHSRNRRLQQGTVAALIAAGWMLLPINLTAVLYVVQRMESIANLFVLLGLIGYVTGRRRMLDKPTASTSGFIVCLTSITVPVAIGVLAKETAVLLPLYALSIEWALFRFGRAGAPPHPGQKNEAQTRRWDLRIVGLFLLVLVLPMIAGLAWLLPGLLKPETWATRDFTLGTRLLSEARVVADYIGWTLIPTPGALSFYHDDFRLSTGLLAPWTTLTSIVFLAALVALMLRLRPRRPLAALGIALFLGCQLLTGTILPLELIYEHRNYFASFGLLLAIVPLLAAPPCSSVHEGTLTTGPSSRRPASAGAVSTAIERPQDAQALANNRRTSVAAEVAHTNEPSDALPLALPRYALLAGLVLCWTALTALTAYAWSSPLRLAEDLAARAPKSPRAQYELGRTYIIYSHYDPTSPFTRLAYAPLEKAAALRNASILPEQALIFMNARMQLPLKDAWWNSLTAKLKAHKSGVQDESSLGALTQCASEHRCDLPHDHMIEAFMAALTHPNPSARLLAIYGDYAWNVLDDHVLGERMTMDAVQASPNEPAYQITLIRMLTAQGRVGEARQALERLQRLNMGGRLNSDVDALRMGLSKLSSN
ncbi:MAG TPA: hypothetical protein VNZ27_07470 [Rhodanobacter sp.]|jgi:hypothetical protein|nr:hypothetical protein [Rhodanobacter sp.]